MALQWQLLDGAMNRDSFETYIEHGLAPALRPGQIVRRENCPPDCFLILLTPDNLSSHKSPRVQALLMAQGNWLLFLPPYSPDLNPIEMAFSKLKTLIRKGAARTYQALWKLVGEVCDPFPPRECRNYFLAAGYRTK